jgi:PhnB protein
VPKTTPKSTKVKPIPEGFHTITPSLTVGDARSAIDFYQRAFGAEEVMVMTIPGGEKVMHAELKIGDSRLFLAEEMPEMGTHGPLSLGGCATQLHLSVNDADAAFERAVSAGATVKQPLADQFWGDRWGSIVDPVGYEWGIGSRKENLSRGEVEQRAQDFFQQMAAAKLG